MNESTSEQSLTEKTPEGAEAITCHRAPLARLTTQTFAPPPAKCKKHFEGDFSTLSQTPKPAMGASPGVTPDQMISR
jgi:hypothetical protein